MKKGMALCAGILRLLLAVSPASGADAALPPDEGTHIPARLVESVARQESSLNPWAVNVAGRDFYPVSREEAEHIITAAERAGASYDVGLMQINRWWIRRYQEIARHGYNWRAVGKYHSPDAERGRRYAWRVYRYYASRSEPGSPTGKERFHAEQKTGAQNLSDAGGIRRCSGQRPQGRIVSFDVQQTGMPWLFRAKSGTPGSPAGTPALER